MYASLHFFFSSSSFLFFFFFYSSFIFKVRYKESTPHYSRVKRQHVRLSVCIPYGSFSFFSFFYLSTNFSSFLFFLLLFCIEQTLFALCSIVTICMHEYLPYMCVCVNCMNLCCTMSMLESVTTVVDSMLYYIIYLRNANTRTSVMHHFVPVFAIYLPSLILKWMN